MTRIPLVIAVLTLSTTTVAAVADPGVDSTLSALGTPLLRDAELLRIGATAVDEPLADSAPVVDADAAPRAAMDALAFVKGALRARDLGRPDLSATLGAVLLPDGSLVTDLAGTIRLEPLEAPAPSAGLAGGALRGSSSDDAYDAWRAAFKRGDAAADGPSGIRSAPADAGPAQTVQASESRASTTKVAQPPSGEGPAALAVLVASGVALGALGLIGFALYHRIRPSAALENDTRKIIFEAVCAKPGLGVHEIADAANVSYSTATYHLERLIGAGMIVMTPDGNKLCYYKNGGAFTESERRLIPILKNQEATRLLEAILEEPGTYRAALANRLGVTATTINWHLRRLRDAGLVDESREGRNAYLYARKDHLAGTLRSLADKLDADQAPAAARLLRHATPIEGVAVHADAASGS